MLVFPRYTLTQRLHEGSDTVILRALRDDQQPVILKAPRDPQPDPRILIRLRHEYELLRELDIPGVVKAHELIEAVFDDQPEIARTVAAALRIDPRAAIGTQPVPLHRGAEEFFQDEKS